MVNGTRQRESTGEVAQREKPKVPEHIARTFAAAVKAMGAVRGPDAAFAGKSKKPHRISEDNKEVFSKINEAEELNNLLTAKRIVEESEKIGVTLWLIGGMNVRTLTKNGRHTHDLDFVTVARTEEDVRKIREMMAGLGYDEERDWGFGLRFKKMIEKTDTQASLVHRVDFLMNLVTDATSRMAYVFSEELVDGGKRPLRPIFSANRERDPELAVEVRCASIYDQVVMKVLTLWDKDARDCLAILSDAEDFDAGEFGKRVRYAHEMLESLRGTAGVAYKYSFGEYLLARLMYVKKLLREHGYDYGYTEEEQAGLQEKLGMLERAVGEYTGATLPEPFARRLGE